MRPVAAFFLTAAFASSAAALSGACSAFDPADDDAANRPQNDPDAASSGPEGGGASIDASTGDSSTVAVQHWLVIAGGNDTYPLVPFSTNEVLAARINPDGTLGPWVAQPPLPAPRSQMASVGVGRSMYLIGGTTAQNTSTSGTSAVLVADVSENGVVSEWRPTTPFVQAGTSLVAATDGTNVFVVTRDGKTHVATPSGNELGAWQPGNPLAAGATPFWPGFAIVGGYAYVLGGLTDNRVHMSTLSSGVFAPWSTARPLPFTGFGQTTAFFGDQLYVIGYADDTEQAHAEVVRTTVNTNGALSNWIAGPALPQARSRACTVVFGEYVYVIGGYPGGNVPASYDTVYFAHANADGSLGGWGTTTKLPTARHEMGCAAF
jgi:hypothetical protein